MSVTRGRFAVQQAWPLGTDAIGEVPPAANLDMPDMSSCSDARPGFRHGPFDLTLTEINARKSDSTETPPKMKSMQGDMAKEGSRQEYTPSGDGVLVGRIVAIQGAVVDVRFPDLAPPINSMLRCGPGDDIVIEVARVVDRRTARGIVMNPMERVELGMEVRDEGHPMQAPVGDGVLGRMIDAFGRPIDGGGPLKDVHYAPIHRAPTPMIRRKPGGEVFETGIKALDLLAPIERGGKAGLFGGAGVGKTVLVSHFKYFFNT